MAIEIYELVIEGRLAGEQRENVLHFQGTGTNPADTQLTGVSLVTTWVTTFEPLFLACLPASYSLELLSARRATPKPSTVVKEQNQFNDVVGTRGTNATTQQISPSIFLVPPIGTKSGGKIFMPGAPQGDVATNQFTAGYITAINAFVSALQTGGTSSGMTWIGFIYSRKLKSGVPIASFHLSPLIGIQNRRRTPVAD